MKIVTFGEALFRFSTTKGERLQNASNLNFFIGGSELNIAANLTSLGATTTWVSSLPDGLTGELMQDRLKSLGVDFQYCDKISNGRAGWYLLETGSTPRPDIVYNRYASSMAEKKNFSFDWHTILKDQTLFHTSGISTGLSLEMTSEVKKAITEAKKKNILVSYDFNYRKNIWSLEESHKRQADIIPMVDFLFCSESDLSLYFNKDPNSKDYSAIFKNNSVKVLILSHRNADESSYGIKLITPNDHYSSIEYQISNIDRIGVGDSMAAGFLFSYLKDKDLKKAADWAALTGALKYSIVGDMALLKSKEVENIFNVGVKGIIR